MSGYGWPNNNPRPGNMYPHVPPPNPGFHPSCPPSFPSPSMAPSQNYFWVNSHKGQSVPPNAVSCGRDRDGSEIYVGLAHYMGDELPAKIVPRNNAAYICYDGKEISVSEYKVLTEKKLTWVHNAGGHIPPGAVPAGRTSGGETLYVGRRRIEGDTMAVGKVHPSHGCLYLPYAGKEMSFKDYEILVYQ